jgi:hypothetical protein
LKYVDPVRAIEEKVPPEPPCDYGEPDGADLLSPIHDDPEEEIEHDGESDD